MNHRDLIARLKANGIDTADLDVRIILHDVAGLSAADLITQELVIPDNIQSQILSIVERRIQGEPLGRILGCRDFWKSRFYLSPETLEPRPDTETVIEAALASGRDFTSILDLGTGSGCILLSLLQEFPNATGIGVDISRGACEAARGNAERLNLGHRVQFIESSWFNHVPDDSRFDLIVSNPPYIPREEIRNLAPEVQNHDPILALDGGADGLSPYKILCPNLKKYLVTGGEVIFEFGKGQGDDIVRIVEDTGATLIRLISDLSGGARVIKFRYGDN
jgi:release factor glutamine methyltransferase